MRFDFSVLSFLTLKSMIRHFRLVQNLDQFDQEDDEFIGKYIGIKFKVFS